MKSKKGESGNKSHMPYIMGIIILIIIIIIVYFAFFNLDIKIKSNKILRCDDGTAYESCSTSKPLYCTNGSLVSIPLKCGCIDGLVVAENSCKNAVDLLPDSNFSCIELAPQDLSIRFSTAGYPAEITDTYNSLKNDIPLKNVLGKYCLNHLPAKAGENINVGNIFYCYGYSSAGGGVDSSGLVKKSYKISYDFTMDKSKCINQTTSATGTLNKCIITSFNCTWNFTN
jgi:hypothetical protein